MLCADVMHVKSVPLLIAKSQNIHFGTADTMPSLTNANLKSSFKKTLKIYCKRGFQVTVALMDGVFESLFAHQGVTMNVTSCDEHVGILRDIYKQSRNA